MRANVGFVSELKYTVRHSKSLGFVSVAVIKYPDNSSFPQRQFKLRVYHHGKGEQEPEVAGPSTVTNRERGEHVPTPQGPMMLGKKSSGEEEGMEERE